MEHCQAWAGRLAVTMGCLDFLDQRIRSATSRVWSLEMISALAMAAAAAGSGILTVDGLAIGMAEGGKWRSMDSIYSENFPEQTVPAAKVAAMAKTASTLLVGKTALGRTGLGLKWGGDDVGPGERGWTVSGGGEDIYDSVIWFGSKPEAPTYTVGGTSSAVYKKAVADYVAMKGIRGAKPVLHSVILADLDGNGTQEAILFAASRSLDDISQHFAGNMEPPRTNEFTVAIVRYLDGGRVRTAELSHDDGRQDGLNGNLSFAGLWDLDGDGRLEIFTRMSAYEAFGAEIYGFNKGKLSLLALAGDGV
jgi:hypothetical protein